MAFNWWPRLSDLPHVAAASFVCDTVQSLRAVASGVNAAEEEIAVLPDVMLRKLFQQALDDLGRETVLDVEHVSFQMQPRMIDGLFKRGSLKEDMGGDFKDR